MAKEITWDAEEYWINNQSAPDTESHPSKALLFDSYDGEEVEIDFAAGCLVYVDAKGKVHVSEIGDFEDYAIPGSGQDLVKGIAAHFNELDTGITYNVVCEEY